MTPVAMNDDKHSDVWVSCFHGNSTSPQGAFLITITEKNTKSLRQETIFYKLCLQRSMQWTKMVGWHWLFAEKKIWKVALCKNRSLANAQHQCFACCSKRIHQISIILVHCIECLSTFSLSLRKLEKLKVWKNRNVPIYLFHASVNIENCIGSRKKILGLGLIIPVRISSAEVFILHIWSNGGK